MSEGRSLVLGPRLSTGLSHSVVKGEDFRAQQPNLRWSHDGSGETDFAFFGIFDGHGGKQVAKYCSKTLHDELQKTLSKQTQFPGALAVDLPGFQAAAKELSAFDGQDAVVQQTPEALVEAFTCADDVCRAMNLVKASRKGKTSSRDDVTVLVVDAIPNEQGRLPAILHRTASGASTSSSSGQDSSEGCLIWKPLEENKGPSVNWRERS
eukprot:evm.model.scf_307EXC.10 EVM.evm.TU.scf_307EXC.10   scf_307EXC:99764-103308(+)